MKEFKGTKGEWEVAGFPSVQVKDTDWCIADCEQSANDEENYANAKLIAAAPELLEALEHFLESENSIKHYLGFDQSILDAIEKGKKAINKAL